MNEVWLQEQIALPARRRELLDWAAQLVGCVPEDAVYRSKEGRTTLRFELDGNAYFLKYHQGVGWREIAKNLLRGRLPAMSARDEYCVIGALQQLEIPTIDIVGFAEQGRNPATLRSLLVTDALTGYVSLEDFCADWVRRSPAVWQKRALLDGVAKIVSAMHAGGINQRDCYLCHFYLEPTTLRRGQLADLRLIDLHRAQIRSRVPQRWRLKDLSGLYSSALQCGLSRRDCLRFVRSYSDLPLRQELRKHASLWRSVEKKARRLVLRESRRETMRILSAYFRDSGLSPGSWFDAQLKLVKTSARATVSCGQLPDLQSVFVKRYLPGDGFRRVFAMLGLNGAKRAARSSYRLWLEGVSVPMPLAVLVDSGPEPHSFLVTEHIENAVDLAMAWQQNEGERVRSVLLVAVARTMADLHNRGFHHGDCKWANILVAWHDWRLRVWFVDLDSVGRHRRLSARQVRDVARFLLNAEEAALSVAQVRVFLSTYCSRRGTSPDGLRTQLQGPLNKLRGRHQRRYGRTSPQLL